MSFDEALNLYWKYYISLENQFLETRKYVELDFVNNGRTYSMEYLKLYQAVCSEIDVTGKALAKEISKDFKPTKNTGINEWWFYVTSVIKQLEDRKCNFFGKHIIQPWKRFVVIKNDNANAKKYVLRKDKPEGKTPTWWNDYNKVKHDRTGKFEKNSTNYAKANLRNLIYAFAALYSLEVELLSFINERDKGKIPSDLASNLFEEKLPFYSYLLVIQ